MPLITRLSRMFRADLHAVLDRVEEPDILLAQAVREMEEALAVDERRLRELALKQRSVTDREQELARTLAEIETKLDLCFESGREELARPLVKRKLESQQLQGMLARRIKELNDAAAALEKKLGENRLRLDSMRQKAELFRQDASEPRAEESWTPQTASIRDEDIEVAFLAEQQKRGKQ